MNKHGQIKLASLLALTLGLVSAGTVLGEATADAPPQRVLQSVRVDLGADGALYGVKGVNVSKTDGQDKPSSDEVDYDPAQVSPQLPVRVLTAYHAGDRTGTDLGDLKGYSGPLRIDITVQNITVHPEMVKYDVDGAAREQYALVGVPLTVVAAAKLGEDAVDRVVTRSTSGGAVTNGVLSQDKSGDATVQWASILAPPQLAPSVTFTLVEDARDFELPSFDLSVQPGLAADSSMQALLRSAFSDQGSSQLRLESDTIELISRVTGVLAQAGSQLQAVRSQLQFSAGTLGTRTISDLTAGTRTVADNTKALSAELKALGGNLGDALTGTRSTAVSEMKNTVAVMTDLLGDTSQVAAAPVISGANCQTTVTNVRVARTVYGQLNQVVTLLNGLAASTSGCRDAIQGKLLESIGQVDANGDAVCASPTQDAVCTINAAGDQLLALAADLAASKDATIAALDPSGLLATTNDKLAALKTAVTNLQLAALDVTPKGGHNTVIDTTVQRLDALSDEVAGMLYDLGGSGSLLTEIDALHQKALDNLGELQGGAGSGSLTQETVDLGKAICDLAAAKGLTDAEILRIQALSTGTDCTGAALAAPPAGYGKSIAQRIADQIAAWQGIADATDTSGPAYAAVGALVTKLTKAKSDLAALKALVTQNHLPRLDRIISDVYSLFSVADDPLTSDCTKTMSDFQAPVNQLAFAINEMTNCKKADAANAITSAFAQLQSHVTSDAGRIHEQLAVVNAARVLSDQKLGVLFDQASQGLGDSAAQITADGKTAIGAQQRRLSTETARFDATLSRAVTSSLKSINTSVAASLRNLQAAGSLLSADLRNVLADLGTRNRSGSGLLGVISAQAAQTRTSAARLGSAGAEATQFGNVRGRDLAGLFLEQAQLRRALELQAAFPAFALDLPDGSQHVTVFAFHMRSVK